MTNPQPIPDSYEDNFGLEYAKSLPTLAESLISVLRFFGCARIYGVGGDYAAPLIAALERQITIAPASNELHAAYAACAQAELRGLGACLVTYTVGSLPAVSAAALARAESLPVVFISGAPGEDEAHEAALHHTVLAGNSWNIDYDAALRAFAALGIRAERLQGARSVGQPNVAGAQFFSLVSHAYLKREPVFIEVPRDLVMGKTQAFSLPPSRDELAPAAAMLAGASVIADTIERKLSRAKKPLLLVGDQLKLNARVRSLLERFIDATGITYASYWSAKGIVDETAVGSLGTYNGAFSDPELQRYVMTEVDYVLDLAGSVYPRETERAFGTGTHVLDGPVDRTVVKATMENQGDLALLLEDLLSRRWERRSAVPPRPAIVDVPDEASLDFDNIASLLNDLQREDVRSHVYVPEVGSSYFATFGLRPRRASLGRSWLGNPWYAAMGTSLPYARVAAEYVVANGFSDRVVVLTGDGGFHFQLNELIHFQRQHLPLTIVYMRNDVFQLGKVSDSEIYSCSDAGFDVGALMKAYGGKAVRCDTAGAFRRAFVEAGRAGGLWLLEVPSRGGTERQSREVRLLNLSIRARSGDAAAETEWRKLLATQG